MSSAHGAKNRVEHDAYLTPMYSVVPIFKEFREEAFRLKWLEPAKGDGRILNLMPPGSLWAEIREGVDYLGNDYAADVGLTNPPFSLAQRFAEKMLEECETVVILQRLNWLGSQKRRRFWQTNRPTHIFVLPERPAFIKTCQGEGKKKGCGNSYPLDYVGECECGCRVAPSTDSVEYAWFVWDRRGVMLREPGVYVL